MTTVHTSTCNTSAAPWPTCRRGNAKAKLAVSDSGSGAIHVYDMRRWVQQASALGWSKPAPLDLQSSGSGAIHVHASPAACPLC